jgi:hypothetical protein
VLSRLRSLGRWWVTGCLVGRFSRKEEAAVFILLWLISMGHCPEQRPGFKVTKDWSGGDQVVIRSPRGSSVRVSRFSTGFCAVSVGRSARHFPVLCGALPDACSRMVPVWVAGKPAWRAGHLMEEQLWRGAPLHQQQGEAGAY